MSDWSYYNCDPQWSAFYRIALRSPNEGYFGEWVQGSSGGQSPLPLWSNDLYYTYLKHGSQTPNPYRGGLQETCLPQNACDRIETTRCIERTLDPACCEKDAVMSAFNNNFDYARKYKGGW